MDKISLIITNYNYRTTLRRAVESALRSSWKQLEVIVVDDGSTDDSLLTIQDYVSTQAVKVVKKENGGQADARHAGVRQASGEWIAFLDADDEIHRERIAFQHKAVWFFGKDCIAMTGSKVMGPRGSSRVRGCVMCEDLMLDVTEDFIEGKVRPSEATMFMSKDLYFRIGGFWTEVRRQAVIEFFSRVIAQGIKIVLVNRPLYIQHEHPASNRYRSSFRTESVRMVCARTDQLLTACSDPGTFKRVSKFLRSRMLLLWFTSLAWAHHTRSGVLKILMEAPWCSGKYRLLFALTMRCPQLLLDHLFCLLILTRRR